MNSLELKNYLLSIAPEIQQEVKNNSSMYTANDTWNNYPLNNKNFNNFLNERTDTRLFTTNNFSNDKLQSKTNNDYSVNLATSELSPNGSISSFFYSARNIKFIQNKLKEKVYKEYNVLISDQDETEILKVMQFIYNNYLLPKYDLIEGSKDFIDSISYLNNNLLQILYKNIIDNIKEYQGYANFVTSGVNPIDIPVNTSIKGTNTLEIAY